MAATGSSFWKIIAGTITLLSVMGTVLKLSEGFYPRSSLVAKGDHTTLSWRVKGYHVFVFLDGQRVAANDSREVIVRDDHTLVMEGGRETPIKDSHTFVLQARGSWGEDEGKTTISVLMSSEMKQLERNRGTINDSNQIVDAVAGNPSNTQSSASSPIGGSYPNNSSLPQEAPTPTLLDPHTTRSIPVSNNAAPLPPTAGEGYLTIRVQPPGTTIEVKPRLGYFTKGVTDLPCSPGTYTIIARHVGLRTEAEAVEVSPGKSSIVEIHLSPNQH